MLWNPDPEMYPKFLQPRASKGRGMGAGASYRPWLMTHDVPSRGTSSRLMGVRIPRLHHFLSELETMYFLLLERQSAVVDIREQFPILHITETLDLCSARGIRHGYKDGYPEPFTIDFLITERVNGDEVIRAASIKSAEDATDPKIMARLAIEFLWCQSHDIHWSLVDTSKFTKTLLENLRFIRGWFQADYQPDAKIEARFIQAFQHAYRPNAVLMEILKSVSYRLRISDFEAQNIFRYCAWSKAIDVDVEKSISLNRPLALLAS